MPEMTEPQSLDQAMDAAMSPEPSAAEATEQEVAETTPAPEPEAAEESYTRIDPKTLPPELQATHKSLLRDYTKKTQALAQQRRELEEMRAGFNQPQQPQAPEQQELQAHPGMSVDEYTAFMLSKVEEKLTAQQQKVLEEQNQQYLDKAVIEFEAADERLNPESPAYDEYMRNAVGSKLDEALNAFTEENGSPIGFDYNSKTEELVKQYEEHLEKKAQAIAQARTQQAFKGVKRTAPTSVSSSQAPSKPVGGMSLDDAIDSAFSQ
jgi:hypothetical protein